MYFARNWIVYFFEWEQNAPLSRRSSVPQSRKGFFSTSGSSRFMNGCVYWWIVTEHVQVCNSKKICSFGGVPSQNSSDLNGSVEPIWYVKFASLSWNGRKHKGLKLHWQFHNKREKYRWCCLELLFSKGPGILDKNHFRFKTAGYSHAGNLDVCPLQDQSRQGENLLLVCPQKNSTSRGCLVLLLRQVDSVHTLFYGNFEIQMV